MRKEVKYMVDHLQTQIENLLIQLVGHEKSQVVKELGEFLKRNPFGS